ncbi:hypothetical protein [Desulfurobacterium sp.]|uniref:hypothetical protein n=1 Tax=Desulfurobacterium sp. TaxID=2004706 RepID=UPI0026345229|nr:hypothetical protein [Desulfurobacterium sp.]
MFRKLVVLVFILPFLLCGCGKSGAPSCDDGSVKDLVKQIVKEKIMWPYVLQMCAGDVVLHTTDKNVLLEYLKTAKDESEKERIRRYIDCAEKELNETSLKLEGFITLTKDDTAKYSECKAVLTIESKDGRKASSNISYSAYYTSDGKLYVEVHQ